MSIATVSAYRFHVLGASHLPVSRLYNACAFTQKIVKLCRMLLDAKHTVFLYGAEGSDTDLATHFVQTHTLTDIRRDFGDDGYNGPHAIGYEWQGFGKGFRHDFETHVASTTQFYTNAVAGINARKRDNDFLLLPLGTHHQPVGAAVGLYLTVEPGIGYRGSYAGFRAFESSYIQYFTYGSENPRQGIDGQFYDRVIPNYYELVDFPFGKTPQPYWSVLPKSFHDNAPTHADYDKVAEGLIGTDDGYYLFLGRIIWRKGLNIAIQVAKHLNLRLIIAGQGHQGWDPETRVLLDQSGNRHQLTERMHFVGYANTTYRSQLMRGAIAVFAPSLYLEPFCGVAVEAQLSGTPVLTTPFGAFVETVEQDKTGVRCYTLADFITGAIQVQQFNRTYIRQRAERLYSTTSVSRLFEQWWRDLYHVYESTQCDDKLGWNRLPDWLVNEAKRQATCDLNGCGPSDARSKSGSLKDEL